MGGCWGLLWVLPRCLPETEGSVQEQRNTEQVIRAVHEPDSSLTCSMFGFSKGGLPRDPSTTGWLICRMHFRSNYKDTIRHSQRSPRNWMLQEWWRWLNAAMGLLQFLQPERALVLPLEHTPIHPLETVPLGNSRPGEQSLQNRVSVPGLWAVGWFSASSNRAQTVGQQPLLPHTDQRLCTSPPVSRAVRHAQPQTHLEQVEIHLLGVRVLLLVH